MDISIFEREKVKDMNSVRIRILKNQGDSRGDSFKIPQEAFRFLNVVEDTHIATILPNSIRGNHYHIGRRELILVLYNDSWVLAWDDKDGSGIHNKGFKGKGALIIEIEEHISHAIKNTGNSSIVIIAFANKKYNPQNSDTVKRIVIN